MRTTERSRTYADGTVLRDSVTALYQPREGINCSGTCTSSVLPLDADGDGEVEFDERGLPVECVLPRDCVETHAPVDVNEDQRADMCSIPPATEDDAPEETDPPEDGPEAQSPEEPPGQPQALNPEQSSEQST